MITSINVNLYSKAQMTAKSTIRVRKKVVCDSLTEWYCFSQITAYRVEKRFLVFSVNSHNLFTMSSVDRELMDVSNTGSRLKTKVSFCSLTPAILLSVKSRRCGLVVCYQKSEKFT